MKFVALSDIIIPEAFKNSQPRLSKLNKIRNYYEEYGYVDKPIIINHKNLLLDGYIRYLVLKENSAEYASVKVVRWISKNGKKVIL